MTQQLDMFAAAAPTFPPHLDPAKVFEVVCRPATDRDHVGEPGAIGSLGNNREVWLVLSLTESGEVLACQTFTEHPGEPEECAFFRADRYREALLVQLKRNSQGFLNL
jgi:hypothetical protein